MKLSGFYSREGKVRIVQIYLHYPSAPAGSNTLPLWGRQAKEKLSHAQGFRCGVFDPENRMCHADCPALWLAAHPMIRK